MLIDSLSITSLITMGLISFFTAGISAATGMGGGLIFLVGLNQFLSLDKVIPLHGIAQLKNNFLRFYWLRKYLIKSICLPFTLGCILGVLFVTYLVSSLESKLIPYILILALVLYSLFRPKKMPELKIPNWAFFFLGLATGFLGILVGAVDPILAPFFLRNDFSRHQVIANKSYFQALIHLAKIPVFLYLGFRYLDYIPLIIVLLATGMLGTFCGLKILDRVSQELFIRVFKVILFAVSLKVAYNIYVLI